MAIELSIHIVAESPSDLSPMENAVLKALAGHVDESPAPQRTGVQTKEEPVAEEKPKTRRKPGPKPKSAKVEESPAEESPAEESPAEESPAEESPAEESPAEESPAEDVVPSGGSVEAAVQTATQLVADGKSSVVKKALSAVGVKRVSELTADQVDQFMSEISK